jgi:hypothetical protein
VAQLVHHRLDPRLDSRYAIAKHARVHVELPLHLLVFLSQRLELPTMTRDTTVDLVEGSTNPSLERPQVGNLQLESVHPCLCRHVEVLRFVQTNLQLISLKAIRQGYAKTQSHADAHPEPLCPPHG